MALKHAEPGEVVDLVPLGHRLATTKTRAIVRTPSFEAVRLVVPAGTEIPSHKVGGQITLQCIEGRVRLELPGGEIDLKPGDWVYLERGEPHSIQAIDDASLLLTILFNGGGSPRG